jgi:hypothetical protein
MFPLVNPADPTIEPSTGPSVADQAPVPRYEIRVRGHLGSRWSAWLDGLSLTNVDDGTTVILGPVVDQAALHGLLGKLRDIGIPLVSLALLPSSAPTTSLHDILGEAS